MRSGIRGVNAITGNVCKSEVRTKGNRTPRGERNGGTGRNQAAPRATGGLNATQRNGGEEILLVIAHR